jgi:glutathione S-transferase
MQLIGQFDSPFVRRVAIALDHYGMPFEHVPWSVWADADAIAARNPLRRVPVLVLDDGEALIDSSAILDAIDDLAPPGRRLIPPSGPVRRAALRACALCTGLGDKAVSLFYERALRKEKALQNQVWIDRCTAQIRDTLDVVEAERGEAPAEGWFGAFGHADVALGCVLRFVHETHPGVLTERARPALASHSARCEAMPLFQKSVQPFHVAL